MTERFSESVLDATSDTGSLSLGWEALRSGEVAEGSYVEIVLPDGVPSSTSIKTLRQIAEILAGNGVVRVCLPPDVGVLKDVTRRLGVAGFERCEVMRGSASFVPSSSDRGIVDLTQIGEDTRTILLYSDGPLSEETVMSYRVALGSTAQVGLATEASPQELEDALLLVVADGILGEPGWLHPVVEAHLRLGTPVGCALVDPAGRRVHVGGDGEQRAWASGSASQHPLLSLTREAELLAPFVLSATDFQANGSVFGTLLGSVQALASADVPGERSTRSASEILGTTLLVVADEDDIWSLVERQPDLRFRPGNWIRSQQSRGWLVVLSVPEFYDPWLCAELASAGVVLNDESTDSGVGELAQLLQPNHIAFSSNSRLERDYALVTRVAQWAELSWIGAEPCARAERLSASQQGDAANFQSRIPSIKQTDSVVGLTSIVIPVYGMWELTERCLKSIQEQTPEKHEIIVVDDCSPDDTLARLVAHDVIVVANAENLGFPGAVNAGIARASGEFVCVLNNDTEVTGNWLSEMHAALAIDGVGMVGPRSNCITGRQAVPKAPQLNEHERAHRWARFWSRQRIGVSWPANTLIGFCLLSRRDLYEQLGGFEEGYGHGNFEDLDMSLRIRDAGFQLRVADAAVVLHHGSATFTGSGIDLDALMQQTYQRFGDRDIYGGGLLTALVLSDGDAEVARKSAASTVVVADETILLERGCLFDAELLTAAGGIVGVRSLSLDWGEAEQLADFISALKGDWIVVLGAGEELVVNEWGRARFELDERTGSAVGVKTPTGTQIRMHAPTVDAIEHIGLESQDPLRRILIREVIL